jgi:hypothetical protein
MNFCTEMGDTGPALTLVRGMMEAETSDTEKSVFRSYLESMEADTSESGQE